MRAGTAFFIAALWGSRPISAQEQRIIDTKKPNTLPSVLIYVDVRAVPPAHWR
jgi:hypothetical protein